MMLECRMPRAVRLLVSAIALISAASASGAEPALAPGAVVEPSTLVTPAEAFANKATPSITIMIPASGRFWVEKRFLEQSAPRQKSDQIDRQPDALEKELVMLCEGDRDMQIYILADRDSRFQSYVDVLKVLRHLNFSRISILAINASKKEQ